MNKLAFAFVSLAFLFLSQQLIADSDSSSSLKTELGKQLGKQLGKEQQAAPPVAELKRLLEDNKFFKLNLVNALKNAQPLPDGRTNPWHGKTETDLYHFLNEWFYFLPTKENGLDRIVEFSLLYYKNPNGLAFINEEPGRSWALNFVEQRGLFLDSNASLPGVAQWLDDDTINNEEFIEPKGGYKSFNDYFVRDIKPGRRPIDGQKNNSIVVAPADCIINLINNEITADSQLPLKGNMKLNVSALLGGSVLAEKFIGGSAYACFLMPDNYHHYHSPVAGVVVEANEDVGSKLFGLENLIGMVNRGNPGYNQDFSVFEDFKHGYLIIETKALGNMAMVPVGLQTVGSVVFRDKFKNLKTNNAAPIAPVPIKKGEAVGHFAYGGSTVLMIFEKGRFNSVSVKQGQQIGIANH